MLKHFGGSLIFTLVTMMLVAYWGWHQHSTLAAVANVLWIASILAVLEVSFSFDNAVVNAKKLETMTPFWRLMFLTVGMLIAVFGMRLVFPIQIVHVTADLPFMEVIKMALNDPETYSHHLHDAHVSISMFGGIFLLLVFLDWLFEQEREHHWLGKFEQILNLAGKKENPATTVAFAVVFGLAFFVMPTEKITEAIVSGTAGIFTYIAVGFLGALLEEEDATTNVAKGGFGAFMYLEVLDASFSFDGVIGAFAVTKDVVIIMAGLAIGAMFVRSMTIYLVEKGTLKQYLYLEHGAHWAIGVLATIMFVSTVHEVPEWFTGLIGVAFIAASVWSSVNHRMQSENMQALNQAFENIKSFNENGPLTIKDIEDLMQDEDVKDQLKT